MSTHSIHWDGAGHTIVDFFGMRNYYRGDKKSLAVLDKCPPKRYEVVPDILIVLNPKDTTSVAVYRYFPGGQTRIRVSLSQHGLEALRRVFTQKKGFWVCSVQPHGVCFERKGRVIPLKPGRAEIVWARS